MLLAALALYGPASGVALAAAEGTLVEARPSERERTLTRLTLVGIAGDALVPLLLLALVPLGLGWRAVSALAACAAFALAWRHARSRVLRRPFAQHDDEGERAEEIEQHTEPGVRSPLRELARVARERPALLGWLAVAAVAGVLDELLVAFASAHLAEFTGASAQQRLLALAAWTLGDLAGVLALKAALARVRPLRILRLAALCAGLALALFLFARSVWVAAIGLGLLGASAITFHPLLMARAYAALPGRPALVGACGALFARVSLVAPLGLALLAQAHGTFAAIATLGAAPVAVLVAALRARDPCAR